MSKERRIGITVSEEDAAMLYELIGLTDSLPLMDLYNGLEAVVDYHIRRRYEVHTRDGARPTLYFFKDGEKL